MELAAVGRTSTETARFGSSRRESHDASGFYERFVAPEVSQDTTIFRPPDESLDKIYCQDARQMRPPLGDNSVALVVTSPPYFAGKEYEEALGADGIPATYFEYLELLRQVFSECKEVLEPGGRIAVNVANLGRRPYRSLASDVIRIFEDLGLLLRGEAIWWKGKAAGSSCAWGTFQSPANPVLRDVTERIILASKGRFDRALKPEERHAQGRPSASTISRDEFLEATTDLWDIPPESATRVGHPAPFPVELPKRLIDLYTFEGDIVLDPFMGSGTTAIAALRTGRHYFGFETDEDYLLRAEQRILEEKLRLDKINKLENRPLRVHLPAIAEADSEEDFQARAVREGQQAKVLAKALLENCSFENIRADQKYNHIGLELNFLADDQTGQTWAFDVSGAFTSTRSGLRRTDTLWKALGKAAVLRESELDFPLILLTTDAPARGSAGDMAFEGPNRAKRPCPRSHRDSQRGRSRAPTPIRRIWSRPIARMRHFFLYKTWNGINGIWVWIKNKLL